MTTIWKSADDVANILEEIKNSNHNPRLSEAKIALAFTDSKPFIKNRFNWGKVSKFSNFNKLWQGNKFDFCITICQDIWQEFLNNYQRNALIDLHLTRCDIQMEPETVLVNNKTEIVKDDFGRVKYTTTPKFDNDGNPKWMILPLDLQVFTKNISRYGLWCEEIELLKSVINKDKAIGEEPIG